MDLSYMNFFWTKRIEPWSVRAIGANPTFVPCRHYRTPAPGLPHGGGQAYSLSSFFAWTLQIRILKIIIVFVKPFPTLLLY